MSYYRLKFTDLDNQAFYSQAKKVQFSLLRSCHLYPNPTSQNSSLEIETIGVCKAVLLLLDAGGKTLFEQQLSLKNGTNTIQLPMINTLSSGIYTVCLSIADNSYSKKLIIQK